MLSTGTFLNADAAESAGLINRSVSLDHLADETDELAQTIASKLGTAVKIGKRAFYEQIQMPVSQAYEFTGNVMVENMLNPDTEQGIAAFLEKRPPSWNQ